MGWRDWFKSSSSSDTPLEVGPSTLAVIFLHRVKIHLNKLKEEISCEAGLTLTPGQDAALFRQLCLFHDALWRELLPVMIEKTGRISPNDVPGFINMFQEYCMDTIAQATDLPDQWRNWGKLHAPEEISEALKRDWDYYSTGRVPEEYAYEFDGVLSFCQAKGFVFERAAYFHMRMRQIIGLEDREKWLFAHLHLWAYQRAFVGDMLEGIPKKVILV